VGSFPETYHKLIRESDVPQVNFEVSYLVVRFIVPRPQLNRLDRRGLFSFRKQSLPFLTIGAIIGNKAFSHNICNTFPIPYRS